MRIAIWSSVYIVTAFYINKRFLFGNESFSSKEFFKSSAWIIRNALLVGVFYFIFVAFVATKFGYNKKVLFSTLLCR